MIQSRGQGDVCAVVLAFLNEDLTHEKIHDLDAAAGGSDSRVILEQGQRFPASAQIEEGFAVDFNQAGIIAGDRQGFLSVFQGFLVFFEF